MPNSMNPLLEQAKAAVQAGDRQCALRILLSLANDGDAQAQYCLGVLYSCGNVGEIDKVEAIHWHEAASRQGYPFATYQLGELYNPHIDRVCEHFDVPPHDEIQSCEFYRQSIGGLEDFANRGDANAAEILGHLYLIGHCGEPDIQQAIHWCTLCVANGGFGIANTLWSLYSGGYRIADVFDQEQAIFWFRKLKVHQCQCLVDHRWEEEMVSKGLLEPSEMSPKSEAIGVTRAKL